MAANAQRKSNALLRAQQERQYFFKHYRRGDADAVDAFMEGGEREAADAYQLTQPAPGRWGGLRGSGYQQRTLRKLLAKEAYEHDEYSNRVPLDDDDKNDAKRKINTLARLVWGSQLRYLKTLGWGGNALAALWECTHRNGRRSLVVMKMCFRNNADARADTQAEKTWLTVSYDQEFRSYHCD